MSDKKIYTKHSTLTIHLKNGEEIKRTWRQSPSGGGRSYWRAKYFYGKIPQNEEYICNDSDEVFGKLSAHASAVINWTLFKRKQYVEYSDIYGNLTKIYDNEISWFSIQDEYKEAKDPKFADLMEDLTFDEFTELLFRRDEHLENTLWLIYKRDEDDKNG